MTLFVTHTDSPLEFITAAHINLIQNAINGIEGGWMASPDTWVYASPSTFTIVGSDQTAIYRVGTLLKMTQSSTLYFRVINVSFSSDTTVTVDTTYDVIANATITDPFYSYFTIPQAYPQSLSSDGWTPDEDTWVYASAVTFTVTGKDRTAKFQKGTRLRFKQSGGTWKYAYVVSSSFSTNTTVTIFAGTDYTLANETITEPGYSYMDNPRAFPDWFLYTMTFTGFSGSYAVKAKFRLNGKKCEVVFYTYTVNTSNATTFTALLPVTADSAANLTYTGALGQTYDNGANVACGVWEIAPSGTSASLFKSARAVWTGSGNKGAGGLLSYLI